jgi:hypothetical protein
LIDSLWLEETAYDTTAVGAACCLSIDLVRAFVDEDPSLLCLHCAAIEIAGKLIVFPNSVRAGKSTLVARLASLGLRVFADDALPIGGPREYGMALGIAPRLRWPLPRETSEDFCAFVAKSGGPRDRRYRYLALAPELLAPHGLRAPIGAIVMLDRRRTGDAALLPVARGACLQQLLEQNFASGAEPVATLDRLRTLLDHAGCFSLTYSDVEVAARVIRDRFHDMPGAPRRPGRPRAKADIGSASPGRTASPARSRSPRYQHAPGVHLREVDSDLFLVRAERGGVFRLSPVAAAIWRLLERPTCSADVAHVLCSVFPEQDSQRIGVDVRRTFRELRRADLICTELPGEKSFLSRP